MIFGSQLCLIELPNLTCVSSFWTKQSLSDLVSLSPCCDLRFYAGARKFLKRFLFGERHLFVAVSYPWKLTYYGRLNRCPFWRLIGISKQPLRYSPSFGGCMELDLPYMPPSWQAGSTHGAGLTGSKSRPGVNLILPGENHERSVKRMRFGG